MKYHSYNLSNLHEIKQLKKLNKELIFNINVVGSVLPFKVNNHVVENLINWNNPLDDPMFHLTFPVKEMLSTEHFEKIADLIKIKADYKSIKRKADKIRESLNPNPAGQQNKNIPVIDGTKFRGIQHKYRETVLFFPSRGQTCHAYCSFCFRWPQFTGIRKYKFSDNQIDRLIHYLQLHPRVTDILITGGDPLTMSTKFLTTFINKLLKMDHPGLQNIRIGTKTLSYWPYRYVTDHDADALLQLFENVNNSGKRIALMAHFNHYRELEPPIVETAVKRILNTGTTIRTQAPLLNHINNSSDIWIKMWNLQVKMGMIPYYFFIARNTGAQKYFAVPLVNAYEIYKSAYTSVSGLARTVRGPVMSCDPGKIQILGLDTINNEDVFVLRFIQGRDNNWVKRIFYAQKNENAIWRDQLKPAFGKARFFYDE